MWMPRRRPEQTHLNRFWNALNRGAPPEELARLAEPLDPSLIAAIDRARALHRRRRPDPAFANRLEHDLMRAFATAPAGSVPLRPLSPDPTNGRTAPHPRRRLPGLPVAKERRRWAMAQLATALLLLATLFAIYLAFRPTDHQAVVPSGGTATPAPPNPAGALPNVPMFAGGPERTGVLPGPGPAATPAVRWTLETGGVIAGAPAVVEGVLYVGSADGNLYARDAVTGQERWTYATGVGIASSPAVVDGTVYVGAGDSVSHAFALAIDAATGRERWRLEIEGPVVSAPLVADGAVYLGTNAGVLYAIDAATGAERWQFAAASTIWAAPSYADGTVFVGSWDYTLYAIDAATGTERWHFAAEGPIWAAPPVVDGVVYVAARGDDMVQRPFRLFALDAADGTKRWQVDLPQSNILAPSTSQNSVAVGGGVVLYLHSHTLYAFDAETGTERRQAQVPVPTSLFEQPVAGDDLVVFPGTKGVLVALDADGATRWQLTLGAADLSWPVIAGDMVFVGATDGVLYALGDGEAA